MTFEAPFCHKDMPRILRYKTAQKLSIPDIANLCQTNNICKSICDDDNFWKLKFEDDSLVTSTKPTNMTWLEWYTFLMDEKVFEKDATGILLFGSEHGYIGLVKYALDNGADIHYGEDKAFLSAANYGYLDIVIYLVEHGADIQADDNAALKTANMDNLYHLVGYLVEHGANIHARDDAPLRKAATNGY